MSANGPVIGEPFQTAYVHGREHKRSDGGAAPQRWWASRGAAIGAWALAGWPVWRWFAARLSDGTDEPWGLAALIAALAFVPWRRLREPLPLGAAGLAAAGVSTVLIGYAGFPPIVRGGLWMLALVALLGGSGPALARAGLLVLSLPVVATAQFYLGYPLRVLTAACSVPLLHGLGYSVSRQGTALRWAGETVLVDAPCSGIQMLWTGLWAACVVAAVRGLRTWATLRLLRKAGTAVAAANVLRCVVLFLVEVRSSTPAAWLHEGIGLVLFGGALVVVAWSAGRGAPSERVPRRGPLGVGTEGTTTPGAAGRGRAGAWRRSLRYGFGGCRSVGSQTLCWRMRDGYPKKAASSAGEERRPRWRNEGGAATAGDLAHHPHQHGHERDQGCAVNCWIALLGLLLLGAAVRPLGPVTPAMVDQASAFPGWPASFEGRALVPLVASEREARFAAGFPGRVVAFSDGERTVVLRWVSAETRKLHPALHCLRGLGYAVQPGPVWRDASGQCWGTIRAERAGRTLQVRERIADGAGSEWTDVSAWWWDAWRGRSEGPWWAVTVLEEWADAPALGLSLWSGCREPDRAGRSRSGAVHRRRRSIAAPRGRGTLPISLFRRAGRSGARTRGRLWRERASSGGESAGTRAPARPRPRPVRCSRLSGRSGCIRGA